MTEREHLSFDHAQEAVKAAALAVAELFAAFPDTMQAHVARNRVALALDSVEDASDYLAAARDRLAQAEQEAQRLADMHEAVHDRMVEREG